MARRQSKNQAKPSRAPSPFPVNARTWAFVVREISLSPQQTRMLELLLQGMRDKQIAAALDIGIPTLRTQWNRIFQRLGVDDRIGLILHVFGVTIRSIQNGQCHRDR